VRAGLSISLLARALLRPSLRHGYLEALRTIRR
jgi:hypothetical protein